MSKRVDVYCPSCRWRGKVSEERWGQRFTHRGESSPFLCPKGPHPDGPTLLVRGTPPKGGTVGRPKLSASERLRRQAAELLAIADELDE